MKLSILTLACLLLIVPSQAKIVKANQSDDVQQQLKAQQGRLANIEEQAAAQRRQVENLYQHQLAELRQLAERKARQLKLGERALWTEFVKMSNQTPVFDTYFEKMPALYTCKLNEALVESYFLSEAADLFMDRGFRERLAELANGSAYNPQSLLVRSQARKLLYFANDLESKVTALQDRRAGKLAAVERWRQYLQADVHRVMGEIEAAPGKVHGGVVSAIMFSKNSPLCMVDGTDKVLKEGDFVGNIVIAKINPDQVEFAKGAQKWRQAVGKPANAAWK